MNVLDHIKEEHDGFKEMISKIESANGDNKKELFREFYIELHGHHEAEEKIIFPLAKEKANKEDLEVVLEMIEEHKLVSYQFSVIEKTPVENETWDAKFSVLKEALTHHMKEEESEFMPIARKLISKETLVDILDKFETVLEENTKEKEEKLD